MTTATIELAAPRPRTEARDLRRALERFEAPILARSLWQIATSLGLFLSSCALMYAVYPISYALTLLLAVPTGALLVRVFIVQHDCGHGAFFASRRWNDHLGRLCSLFTLAPYENWRRQHAAHHGNWNNLDRRLSGSDIYSSCLTVREYEALPRRDRVVYRIGRHPIVANLLLPPFIFFLLYRVPFDTPRAWWRERLSVHATNLAIAALVVALGLGFGFTRMILIQVPVMLVASTIGVWLFSVQHRFEGALWARQADWTATRAALEGSSYLRLPRVLQWFTGNIGLHHIHHLAPRVPNYRLQDCQDEVAALGSVRPQTLVGSFAAMRLALWDEERGQLVGFSSARGAL